MPSVTRLTCSFALPSFIAAFAAAACSHDKPPEAAGYQQGQVQYGQQTAGQGGLGYAAGGVGGHDYLT